MDNTFTYNWLALESAQGLSAQARGRKQVPKGLSAQVRNRKRLGRNVVCCYGTDPRGRRGALWQPCCLETAPPALPIANPMTGAVPFDAAGPGRGTVAPHLKHPQGHGCHFHARVPTACRDCLPYGVTVRKHCRRTLFGHCCQGATRHYVGRGSNPACGEVRIQLRHPWRCRNPRPSPPFSGRTDLLL